MTVEYQIINGRRQYHTLIDAVLAHGHVNIRPGDTDIEPGDRERLELRCGCVQFTERKTTQ